MSAQNPKPLFEIRGLTKSFGKRSSLDRLLSRPAARQIHVLNGINLDVARGETLALVGESGCGKSTLARCLVRLYEPDSGDIRYDGTNIGSFSKKALRQYNRRVQMVFQDPYGSLNPRKTIGTQLADPIRVHGIRPAHLVRDRVRELLDLVRLPADAADRYPHAFSGGQRQRIGIARALSLEPDCLIADEPVAALDVSIQAQIINLLLELQERLKLTMIFVSHDLRVVRHIAHRVAVMYLGRIVECGPSERVFSQTLHPYAEALIGAAPSLDYRHRATREVMTGEIPSVFSIPTGCAFHTRCPHAFERCHLEIPKEITPIADHMAACHLVEAGAHEIAGRASPKLKKMQSSINGAVK
jgi:oligopeptide transport system ATP-binding protein